LEPYFGDDGQAATIGASETLRAVFQRGRLVRFDPVRTPAR